MGHIYENHGKIAIEGRRESFYVHASYGYSPKRVAISSLPFGAEFVAARNGTDDLRRWKVWLIAEDRIEGRDVVSSVVQTFARSAVVVDPDSQAFDPDAPLAELWAEYPHPEFAKADLDDLIEALVEYRDRIRA